MTARPLTQKQIAQRVVAALRVRHPHLTSEAVARRTGVRAAIVEKWLNRGSAPSLSNFLKLLAAYDGDFLAEVAGYANAEDRRLARILSFALPMAEAGRDTRILSRYANLITDAGPFTDQDVETALARHRDGTLALPEATR